MFYENRGIIGSRVFSSLVLVRIRIKSCLLLCVASYRYCLGDIRHLNPDIDDYATLEV